MSYAALPSNQLSGKTKDEIELSELLFDRAEDGQGKHGGIGHPYRTHTLDDASTAKSNGPTKGSRQYASIDWISEYNAERERRLQVSSKTGLQGFLLVSWDASQVWLIIIMTGLSIGVLATCLIITSTWLSDLRLGHCASSIILSHSACCQGLERDEICYEWHSWRDSLPGSGVLSYFVSMLIYVSTSTAMAWLASWQIATYSPLAFHTGIPEIKAILGGFVFDDYLRPMVLFIKTISLAFASASGLVLGKEGPLVHIACCVGSNLTTVVSRLYPKGLEPPYLHNNAKRREILSAASAAGVSVAFGAPVGGVLFALEEISYYYPDRIMWHSFVCAMIAALSLQRMDPFHTGKLVLYQVTSQEAWRGFELPFFVFLGVAGGLCGALFIRANIAYELFRKSDPRLSGKPIREVVLIALVTSIVCFFIPYSRVSMSELVEHLLSGCEEGDWENLCGSQSKVLSIAFLLVTAFVKYVLAIVTFGALIPAGIFLPSLTVGACLGRAIGISVESLYQATKGTSVARIVFSSCPVDGPCITPAVYAVIGAASLMGGITRMTLSLVVILFELTGALTYVLPIMIAVMTSKWVGDSLTDSTSIYEAWIRLRGYPFLGGENKADTGSDRDDPPISRPSFHASRTELTSEVDLEDDRWSQKRVLGHLMRPYSTLQTIPAFGFSLADAQNLLKTSRNYRGFPVIFQYDNPVLVGYLAREALESAIDHAPSKDLQNTTLRFFSRHSRKTSYLMNHQFMNSGHIRQASLGLNINGDLDDMVDFSKLQTLDMRDKTNMTPLTLSPKFAISQASILFKRMGPRYILVTQNGRLKGLITRSDMWRRSHGEVG